MMCRVVLCLVLACCVQHASSQYFMGGNPGYGGYSGYGGSGNAYWSSYMRRYWQTRVTTTQRSCGGVRHDTARTVCCSGRVLPRVSGCGCCGRTTYQVVNRMCCSGSVTYRRIGYNSCCGGRGYNSNFNSCNRGSVVGGYNNYM
ncbi:hypothetical protein LSAT2_020895 [Lamellibrachia satsuma]|nr:hypothetical protein LSAT2_020895 [Lamellibrachia satsuma]